jgi:hypothetical protein
VISWSSVSAKFEYDMVGLYWIGCGVVGARASWV